MRTNKAATFGKTTVTTMTSVDDTAAAAAGLRVKFISFRNFLFFCFFFFCLRYCNFFASLCSCLLLAIEAATRAMGAAEDGDETFTDVVQLGKQVR